MSKRVADVLIETLQAAGVKRCCGIVGDTLNRIAYAIHESEIEWRHEEAGAFAASAEGQFTGELVAPVPGGAPVIPIATQVVRHRFHRPRNCTVRPRVYPPSSTGDKGA
jgi:thiamine pyrophosphate-dependent acetolactate synthase large subunit-like protein